MPNSEIPIPASSAPTDRLALGVGWVRPSAAGIGSTVNPAGAGGCIGCYNGCIMCFEGRDE